MLSFAFTAEALVLYAARKHGLFFFAHLSSHGVRNKTMTF